MSTERQKRANADNAARSTGPRTAEGRAISSGNARKHGLNSPPPWDETRSFLFLIAGDEPADPSSLDPQAQAALALAEAETRVARCVKAERRHLARMAELAAQYRTAAEEEDAQTTGEQDGLSAYEEWRGVQFSDQKRQPREKTQLPRDPDQPEALHQTLKTLMRYRREAEAQRRKALRRWLELQQVDSRTNPEDPLNL